MILRMAWTFLGARPDPAAMVRAIRRREK